MQNTTTINMEEPVKRGKGRPRKGEIVLKKEVKPKVRRAKGMPEEDAKKYREDLNRTVNFIKSPENIALSTRFFQAIDLIIEEQMIFSFAQFTIKHEVNYSHLLKAKNSPGTRAISVVLFAALIEYYGISADWLMTGKGEPFKR